MRGGARVDITSAARRGAALVLAALVLSLGGLVAVAPPSAASGPVNPCDGKVAFDCVAGGNSCERYVVGACPPR